MKHCSYFLVVTLILFLLLPFLAQAVPTGVRVVHPASIAPMQSSGPGRNSMGPRDGMLRDIKGPLPLTTITPVLLWTGVGAVIALVMIGFLIWWWLRLKKRGRKQKAVPAHETALARLDEARALMDPRQAREFAAVVADILRDYIEARFFLSASRQTTRELISSLTDGTRPAPPELAACDQELRTWLEHCDMAKFACCAPSIKIMREMEDAVRNFVMMTRLEDNKK